MPAGIHMTMKKVTGRSSYNTMSHASYHTLVCSNYEESVKRFVSSEKGFLFMNQIQGTPTYWKKFEEKCWQLSKN